VKTEAAIGGKDGVVRLLEVELPPMSDTRVRVKTWLGGVSCGTEGDTVTGRADYLPRPCLLGYQAVGRIVEAGAKAANLKVGDLVFTTGGALWKCENCFGGSHARESVAESADVIKLDPALSSPTSAAYGLLAAVAAEGLYGMKLKKGAVLLVFGLGMLGQMTGKLAQLRGVKVIGVNRSAWKREAALALGFDQAVPPEAGAIKAAVEKIGLGPPLMAVDTTGRPELFDLAFSQLGAPAEMALLGYYPEKQTVDFNLFHQKRLTIFNPVGGGNHLGEILRLVEQDKLDLGPLIRHVVAPSEITSFYADLVKNHSNYLGAVIDWSKT